MIGTTISHYKILEKLGEGGMGVVYKAEDTKLKRQVALKFLPGELTRSDEWRQRFLREAQAAAALAHPNICTIHEIDEEEGQTFIAMECIDGGNLNETIRSGPMDVAVPSIRSMRDVPVPASSLYIVLAIPGVISSASAPPSTAAFAIFPTSDSSFIGLMHIPWSAVISSIRPLFLLKIFPILNSLP